MNGGEHHDSGEEISRALFSEGNVETPPTVAVVAPPIYYVYASGEPVEGETRTERYRREFEEQLAEILRLNETAISGYGSILGTEARNRIYKSRRFSGSEYQRYYKQKPDFVGDFYDPHNKRFMEIGEMIARDLAASLACTKLLTENVGIDMINAWGGVNMDRLIATHPAFEEIYAEIEADLAAFEEPEPAP